MTGTVRLLALCAALCSFRAVHAEGAEERASPATGGARSAEQTIDWNRGVIKAMGRGAPDLNAPSIAVGRAAAERAALVAAQRNALRILETAMLDDGSRVESLLHDDAALRTRVESKLRGVRAARTRYFTDGGVWLDIEVPFGILPPQIAQHLRSPDVAPDGGVETLLPDAGALDGPPDAGARNLAPDAGTELGDGGERPR